MRSQRPQIFYRRPSLSFSPRPTGLRGSVGVGLVAGAFLVAPSTAVAATENRSVNDRLCASAVNGYQRGTPTSVALEPAVPAPIAPFLRAELDAGEGPAVPWQTKRGGEFAGVAVAHRGRETTLRTCETIPESRYVQAAGKRVTLKRRERLVGVAVAYPWIAWATAERGGPVSRPTVRWRRLTSSDRTTTKVVLSRRLTALVPDVGGHLTTSTVGGGIQRIETHDRAGRSSRIATVRNVRSAPREALSGNLRDVWLWEPRTLAIHGDIVDSFSDFVALADFPKTAPSRIVDLPLTASPCGRKSPGDVERIRTSLASIDFIDAGPWSNGDATHMRLCDAQGRLVARGTLAALNDGGSSFGSASLIGNALTVEGIEAAGSSAGSGIERTVRILNRTPSGRLVIARQDDTDVLAISRTAAAWITTKTRQLWVSDNAGVRRIDVPLPPAQSFPDQEDEARLTLADTELQVRIPQGETTSIPIVPLPATAVGGSAFHPVDQGCEDTENRTDTCAPPPL